VLQHMECDLTLNIQHNVLPAGSTLLQIVTPGDEESSDEDEW